MKLAWLVKEWLDDDDSEWSIVFSEPSRNDYRAILPIVYAVLVEAGAPE